MHIVRGHRSLWYLHLSLSKIDNDLVVELEHLSLVLLLNRKVGAVLDSLAQISLNVLKEVLVILKVVKPSVCFLLNLVQLDALLAIFSAYFELLLRHFTRLVQFVDVIFDFFLLCDESVDI